MPSLFILKVTLIETREDKRERQGSYYQSTKLWLVITVLPIDFGEPMLRYHPCDAGERVGRVGI